MAPTGKGLAPAVSSTESHNEVAVAQQSSSALANARRNLKFLINPTQAAGNEVPARLRTRALLRSVRYITQFIFWRLVRWAKYAAVGAIAAAIGATAIGGFVSGIGWIVAPPSIGASIVAMGIWQGGGFVARRLHRRWKSTGMDVGQAQRERLSDDPRPVPRGITPETGPQTVPW